ncbi:MAG: phospho-sugar mutase [Eubacteriales bacterium]|nr:phospho-sugar mutase [Eubacteriales bacterium]MDD3350105.1 phospho-sugar mutase [Eubacteriales bacterium]
MENQTLFLEAYDKMERWLAMPTLSPKLKRELKTLEERLEKNSGDSEAREDFYDRFYKDLDFGTGGLRGILGAGTNRMNIYTVRRVTQGFANYLRERYKDSKKPLAVALAYDSRHLSQRFALEAGGVLVANGFRAYLYPELMPTPALSFAVRHYSCCGGIMITASHNPSNYNGFKAYNEEGCQVNLTEAEDIIAAINKVDIFDGPKTLPLDWELFSEGIVSGEGKESFLDVIPQEVNDAYFEAVKKTRVGITCDKLSVVYTPLNGTGNKPVRRILDEIGIKNVYVVPEQELPDGNFPTCSYPNPEKEEALQKGLECCSGACTADLLLATDPDCDRLGIAVKQEDKTTGAISYPRMTGNEIGVLLLDFLCKHKTLPDRAVAMKTIVSTKMADAIAAKNGIEMRTVLTGFKFIGEQIGFLEKDGEEERFFFGFEESYGFLAGSYVRDKDAVNAAMLVCEAAAAYKEEGKTLIGRMEELYREYGYFVNDLVEFGFAGALGMQQMEQIMYALRKEKKTDIIGCAVTEISDYKTSERWIVDPSEKEGGRSQLINLPPSDVLEYVLADGSSLTVRPSGTEPKIKIYLSAKAETAEKSKIVIEKMKNEVQEWVKI